MSDHHPETAPSEPDAYRAPDGSIWINLRKHPDAGGVFDATVTSTPLWLSSSPGAQSEDPS